MDEISCDSAVDFGTSRGLYVHDRRDVLETPSRDLDAPPPPESGGETAKTSGSETVQTLESGAEVAAGSEVADDAEVEEERERTTTMKTTTRSRRRRRTSWKKHWIC